MTTSPIPVNTAERPVDATVRPPGSKSETIRAMTAAALADGRSHLYGALDAKDTEAMSSVLRALGIEVSTSSEPWLVEGTAGWLRPSAVLDVGESGLTARIALVLASSIDGTTVLTGRGRLPDRPLRGLIDTLRGLGVEIDGERLPLEVTGHGRLWGGSVQVDCSSTTQFATALMLAGPIMQEPMVLELKGLVGSAGYLEITANTMRRFGATLDRTITGYEIANSGYRPTDIVIEPDASAAVYPLVAAAITGGRVVIEGLGSSSRQPDMTVARALEVMGCRVAWDEDRVALAAPRASLTPIETDMSGAPDGALGLVVACLFAAGRSRISGLGSLRHKESDRLEAMSAEIRRLGGHATVDGDTLIVGPGHLRSALIDPHGDHRIAMSMAVAGLVVPGVEVADPGVVDKTWPGFWTMLNSLAG